MRCKGSLLLCGALALVATGCGYANPSAHEYAKSACTAYRETGRVQVTTTVDQASAIRNLARSNARAAAAFDPRWESLSSDMQAALDLQGSWENSPPYQKPSRLDHFFEIDKLVQDDCRDAGRDIGDLTP